MTPEERARQCTEGYSETWYNRKALIELRRRIAEAIRDAVTEALIRLQRMQS